MHKADKRIERESRREMRRRAKSSEHPKGFVEGWKEYEDGKPIQFFDRVRAAGWRASQESRFKEKEK